MNVAASCTFFFLNGKWVKAFSHLSPFCSMSTANVAWGSTARCHHFHVCSYKHGRWGTSEWEGVCERVFSTSPVKVPFHNVVLTHAHTLRHPPSSAHRRSLVQVQIWWGWSKRRDGGGSWGISLFLSCPLSYAGFSQEAIWRSSSVMVLDRPTYRELGHSLNKDVVIWTYSGCRFPAS